MKTQQQSSQGNRSTMTEAEQQLISLYRQNSAAFMEALEELERERG